VTAGGGGGGWAAAASLAVQLRTRLALVALVAPAAFGELVEKSELMDLSTLARCSCCQRHAISRTSEKPSLASLESASIRQSKRMACHEKWCGKAISFVFAYDAK
jgi:hypothetical protein